MRRKKQQPPSIRITIKVEGRQIQGSYYVEGGMVTVASPWGRKSTQIGDSPAEVLARIMLREQFDAAKSRGDW